MSLVKLRSKADFYKEKGPLDALALHSVTFFTISKSSTLILIAWLFYFVCLLVLCKSFLFQQQQQQNNKCLITLRL